MKMKVGLGQLLVEGGEPERNFMRAEKLVKKAVEANCDMIMLPETIDFAWTHPSGLKESHPIPGPYSEIFCNMAREYGIWIVVGLTERDGERNYNAALMIDDQGQILMKHRKINLLTVEFPFYSVGQTINVIDTKFGKLGLNICADNYIDGLHIGHSIARMGAQVLLSPSSWTVDHSITEEDDPYADKWIKPLSILANYHNMVVLSTTSVGYIVGGPYEGKKMVGCSLAVNKDGILMQGYMNEFAGLLETVEFEIPIRDKKGIEIGQDLVKRGYTFDTYLKS